MMNRTRALEQAAAEAEHRERDDAAQRLRDLVPGLRTLRLRFEDIRGEGHVLVAAYARVVVVASAAARFDTRCMEPRCDGRHDLTPVVMAALRRREPSFSGRSSCPGMVGDRPCDRSLAFVAEATFDA